MNSYQKNNFYLTLFAGLMLLFLHSAKAQEITSCFNPKGQMYMHHAGLILDKKITGWQEDSIKDGIFTLKKLDDGEYDILILDARKELISFRQDGASITLLRKGAKDATFLFYAPGAAMSLFSFWEDYEGNYKMDRLSSKGGDRLPIHSSSLMIGDCKPINFSLID